MSSLRMSVCVIHTLLSSHQNDKAQRRQDLQRRDRVGREGHR